MKKKPDQDTEYFEPEEIQLPEPQRVAVSSHGMVSTAHFRATEVGVAILEQGGNAIDAAVASAFALGVCEPQASGLGGQTMMLLHSRRTNKTIAIDGSSRAPNRAVIDFFKEKSSRIAGHSAATVPSTPATLSYVLERYGSISIVTNLGTCNSTRP